MAHASARYPPSGGGLVLALPAVRRLLVLVLAPTAAVAVASPLAAATDDAGPPPSSMASLGDSITRGFDACGFFVDCSSRSWATGDNGGVNSHYLRIRRANPAISGHHENDAKTGAMAGDLAGQAQTAVGHGVGYVTVLIGANDACRDSEAQMTPVPTFRSEVDAGLDRISTGLPNARILVLSIPDIMRLWQVGKGNLLARTVWAVGGICQSMLAHPTSTAPADVDRRNRVRRRVIDFNAQLAASCAAHPHCRFDGGAVFGYQFTLDQLSGWDYFHPNPSGQAVLAQVSYAAGFGW
jgi:lysophospholipase L1-like esterase